MCHKWISQLSEKFTLILIFFFNLPLQILFQHNQQWHNQLPQPLFQSHNHHHFSILISLLRLLLTILFLKFNLILVLLFNMYPFLYPSLYFRRRECRVRISRSFQIPNNCFFPIMLLPIIGVGILCCNIFLPKCFPYTGSGRIFLNHPSPSTR